MSSSSSSNKRCLDRTEVQEILSLDNVALRLVAPMHEALVSSAQKMLLDDKSNEYDVMCGAAGLACLYFELWRHCERLVEICPDWPFLRRDELAERAQRWLSRARRYMKSRRHVRSMTFLCGAAGLRALCAVFAFRFDANVKRGRRHIDLLLQCYADDESTCDELLYGRVGHLYALLFVCRHLADNDAEPISLDAVRRRIDALGRSIAASGRETARKEGSSAPFLYYWHSKPYLGGAHGVTGIAQVLAQAGALGDDDVDAVTDYLLSKRYAASGNIVTRDNASCSNANSDRLVQFCHGITAPLFFIASSERALKRAGDEAIERSVNVLLTRGFLAKGAGLCHGLAGNAMPLLQLHARTGDARYLEHAWLFASAMRHFAERLWHEPDEPYSLFNGLAGALCFVQQLILATAGDTRDKQVEFIGYQL
jgi:glutathione transferase